MPVMDGFEVLTQCKSTPCLHTIPVIVLAADHDDKLKSLQLGADDFLAKPYDLEELELRITRLIRSRRLAQSAERAKDEFLALARHELRTPMHQIMGLADLLDGRKLDAEQRELIDLLKQATGSLTGVIRDILEYVQLDHGTAHVSLELFSLRATIQAVIDSLNDAARQKAITLVVRIGDDVSDTLNGPSRYVYTIFRTLIENAVKFSTAGTVEITIQEERLGSSGSRFCCSVSDQGVGIPAALQDKIFEPFVQVDATLSRKFEGIGLGLAIAKRMVELMGGHISVHSDAGAGSIFNFSFHCDLRDGI